MILLPGQAASASIDQLFWVVTWLDDWHLGNAPVAILIFNLLLLVVPWWALRRLEKLTAKKLRGWRWLAAGFWAAVFFIFLPNAAYLIADVRHLSGFCPPSPYLACLNGLWQVPIFSLLCLTGAVSFVYLLNRWQNWLTALWGKRTAAWLTAAYLPLVGWGVMFGLVERWSSWQALTAPGQVLVSAAAYFSWSWRLADWLIFTAFLSILYYFGRWIRCQMSDVRCRTLASGKNKKF